MVLLYPRRFVLPQFLVLPIQEGRPWLHYWPVTPWLSFSAALFMTACLRTRPAFGVYCPFPATDVKDSLIWSTLLFIWSSEDPSFSSFFAATTSALLYILTCSTPFLFLYEKLMSEDPSGSMFSCFFICSGLCEDPFCGCTYLVVEIVAPAGCFNRDPFSRSTDYA
ncbi:hypothetical protein B0H12DRAFT_761768 [Mycena haematopus]|nr:hypothetical protein B0H12DRAFT_761768 [Mycena haematopus]